MKFEDQRALRYKGTDREGNRASLFEWMVAVEYILFQLFEVNGGLESYESVVRHKSDDPRV